ncbi:MAG: NADH dehydrogenase subunit [Bacteroidia bacterium]
MNTLQIKNNQSVSIADIPVFDYEAFYAIAINLCSNSSNHIANYYAYQASEVLKFICAIADDNDSTIHVFSHELTNLDKTIAIDALSKDVYAFHLFEREISENFGVEFLNHPWNKPVRYAFDRADKSKTIQNYPFLHLDSDETHEVGVGPIHAGIIEAGHFRFLCNGEQVLHLEIQLGYQHRGIEKLFLAKKHILQQTVLSESITGDSAVSHTLAYVANMETLLEIEPNARLNMVRALALEMERMAIHVGDLSGFCLDVAYQLGSSVFGALRTPLINYMQWWCGNRFGKGLIRVGYNPYAFTPQLKERLIKTLEEFEAKYMEMAHKTFEMPSLLNRFEKTGKLAKEQAELIGAVGLTARMTGLARDVRTAHPFGYFKEQKYDPVLMQSGDVFARGMARNLEVQHSLEYIRIMLAQMSRTDEEPTLPRPDLYKQKLKSNQFVISLVEGWRGEICHCAITNEKGELAHYKVKDPSFHNWMGLALAMRDNEISDFPINNKSFDLSYCGFDL